MSADRARLRGPVLLCLCLAPFGWFAFWAVFHTVPGQDWVVFHTAAARFFAHDLAMLYDPQAFTDELNRTHADWMGQRLVMHPFVYPPVTLLLALAFGWLPYMASLVAFLGVSVLVLVAALWMWRDVAAPGWLVGGVLACPATAFTLGSGQLSFLVAAWVLAGMAWLPTRPFLAGLAWSLLCLKPQFVPMVPVALLAGRHWRAMAGGLAGGAALVLLSLALVGARTWSAWISLAAGQTGLLGSLVDAVRVYDQSVHTCLRLLGAGEDLAGAFQIVAFLLSAACVWLAFARPLPPHRRLVVLLCAMVVGAPHVGDYDDELLAVAALLTVLSQDWRRPPVWLAAATWLATMFNPPALVAVLGVKLLVVVSALTPLLPAALMVRAAGGRFSPRPLMELTPS